MSEKINEQAEKMREMGTDHPRQGEGCCVEVHGESQKLREKADSGVRATYLSIDKSVLKRTSLSSTQSRGQEILKQKDRSR